MTVGNRIKQRRLELGLTQKELAEKMGYSGKTSVCAAEMCGDNITTTKVKKFADALGVTTRYLMGYEDRFGEPIPSDRSFDEYTVSKKEELYTIYSELPPERQKMFEEYIKFLQAQS